MKTLAENSKGIVDKVNKSLALIESLWTLREGDLSLIKSISKIRQSNLLVHFFKILTVNVTIRQTLAGNTSKKTYAQTLLACSLLYTYYCGKVCLSKLVLVFEIF